MAQNNIIPGARNQMAPVLLSMHDFEKYGPELPAVAKPGEKGIEISARLDGQICCMVVLAVLSYQCELSEQNFQACLRKNYGSNSAKQCSDLEKVMYRSRLVFHSLIQSKEWQSTMGAEKEQLWSQGERWPLSKYEKKLSIPPEERVKEDESQAVYVKLGDRYLRTYCNWIQHCDCWAELREASALSAGL